MEASSTRATLKQEHRIQELKSVSWSGQMEIDTKDNSDTGNVTEKESDSTLMEAPTSELMKKTNRLDLEYIPGQTKNHTRASGRTASSMGRESRKFPNQTATGQYSTATGTWAYRKA